MVPDDSSHRGLLLLPEPPSKISLGNLRSAYGPALTRVLRDLAQVSARSATKQTNVYLSIAVAYNGLSSPSYANLQQFFGLMYRLACVISTANSIDVLFGNDVDVEVLLVYSVKGSQHDDSGSKADRRFIELADLDKRQSPWINVFSVESEVGEELLRAFLHLQEWSTNYPAPDLSISRVPGGLTMQTENEKGMESLQSRVSSWSSHRSVAVGGTFDHLHAGHRLLLTMTALVLDPVEESDPSKKRFLTIGITGDDLLANKKYPEELEAWGERQGSVKRFLLEFLSSLSLKNMLKNSEIITNPQVRGREIHDEFWSGLQVRYKEIFDPFGPTITDPTITALIISGETRAGGKAVNDKRAEKAWQLLEIFEVDVLDATEVKDEQSKTGFESKISSTEIRSRIRQKELRDAKT